MKVAPSDALESEPLPGLVVDAPSDDADLVVDLRIVVDLGVDAAVVTLEPVGHLKAAA